MPEGIFGTILYSKIQDQESFELYVDNLHSFFNHLSQPELIKRVYFVDDSDKEFQTALKNTLLKLIAKTCPQVELVDVIDNGSIYNAVNRVWTEIDEEYTINFQSDYRLIQTLPLATIKKALDKYPDVYSIHIVTRMLFGYTNQLIKQEMKRKYPYYKDFDDEEMEAWFCLDERGKVYTLPQRLYLKQKAGLLPKEVSRGIELVPRIIDEENTLWTPRWPAKVLKADNGIERFNGGPCIFRSVIIKKYLPLPKRYINEEPAECAEGYFLKTDIDCKYYSGYLNLQVFAVQYRDPERPLPDIERDYWEVYLQRNSVPVTHNKIDSTQLIKTSQDTSKGIQFFTLCGYCCLKSFLRWQLENLAIFLFGKERARRIKKFLKF